MRSSSLTNLLNTRWLVYNTNDTRTVRPMIPKPKPIKYVSLFCLFDTYSENTRPAKITRYVALLLRFWLQFFTATYYAIRNIH